MKKYLILHRVGYFFCKYLPNEKNRSIIKTKKAKESSVWKKYKKANLPF